ncbi:hypothetical protein MYP14_24885 (plasmid) [Rhodococcus pyridinivorans]|uniref:hypothetical protein n=1 Tax=Rhodococcus pyridinivorans TaxID=103816 RepID=UPI001FFE5128|nr:hypothetical protein [Rhodococcus pyridinivorans]UPK66469.1 hypothetical protein MYP14_24885 [Rhodococcus pyridinivorans]
MAPSTSEPRRLLPDPTTSRDAYTATIIVTFTLRGLPGRVCAQRYPLFNRDGEPALWRGAPTLMESILLGIDESGGIARLKRTEPGAFGWIWK